MIDHLASTVALAKTMRMALGADVQTSVDTAQLRLVLDTLIDVGTPVESERLGMAAAKAVSDHVAEVEIQQRFAAEDQERARV
jgi:hypothetical protein